MNSRKRLAFKKKARATKQTQEAVVAAPVTKAAPPVVAAPVTKTAPKVVVPDTLGATEAVTPAKKKEAPTILPKKKKKTTSSVKTSS